MNERMRILRLLEEGKINADEAARLLEALTHSSGKKRKERFHLLHSLEGIPDIIATAINSSMKFGYSTETLTFPIKNLIEFKGISGKVEVTGQEVKTVTVEQDGLVKIIEKDDSLKIKTLSGDIKVITPPSCDLKIAGISGDLLINNIDGRIQVESVSGDIRGYNINGTFFGDFVSGDTKIDFNQAECIKIKSRSGDITITLPDNVQVKLDVVTEDGDIVCDFILKDEERSETSLKGIINKPKGSVQIINSSGDVTIKRNAKIK